MSYSEKESYKHKYAKEVFKQWSKEGITLETDYDFTIRCDDGDRTALEYPIVKRNGRDSTMVLWDEHDLCPDDELAKGWAPTYETCVKNGYIPIAIVDLMIPRKGMPGCYIEICHTNPVSEEKAEKLAEAGVTPLFEIDADWILNQTKRPDKIKVKYVY